MTDGPPALALGMDPVDPGIMSQLARKAGEGVISREMWVHIVVVGLTMAIATLAVLDASLGGGLIQGNRGLRHGRTMAFTNVVVCQLFNVF